MLLLNGKASVNFCRVVQILVFSNSPSLNLECFFAHGIHAGAVLFLVSNQVFSTA